MKNFKLTLTTILAALSLLAMNGCNASSSDSATPGADGRTVNGSGTGTSDEGGISAGGGGTLPANPIGVYRVMEIADGLKRELRMYFNYNRKYAALHDPDIGNDDDYYWGKENFSTILEKTDLEILQDQPCHDKNGKEVDGSIYASRPNTICISAFRIAPKLVEEVANKEIAALVIHEFSHLLGADEKRAIQEQQFAATMLDSFTARDSENLENTTWDATDRLDRITTTRDSIDQMLKAGDLISIKLSLKSLSDSLSQLDSSFQNLPLAYWDYNVSDYLSIMEGKLVLADWYLDSITLDGLHQQLAKETYEHCFAGNDSVQVKNMTCGFINPKNIYGEYSIVKMKDPADLHAYLSDVFTFVSDMQDHVRAIAFNQPVPYFHLPSNANDTNPWQGFIGKYKTELVACDSDLAQNWNPFTGFQAVELSQTTSNFPVENQTVVDIREERDNSSGHLTSNTLAYNGGYDNGAVKVAGDANKAVMTAETGTRWYDRQGHGWQMQTRTIEKNQNGELVYSLRLDQFSMDAVTVRQGFATCQYKLHQ